MEVVRGIHRVDGTLGGNVCLLLDDAGLTLVDAALPGNGERILRYIVGLGRALRSSSTLFSPTAIPTTPVPSLS